MSDKEQPTVIPIGTYAGAEKEASDKALAASFALIKDATTKDSGAVKIGGGAIIF